MSDPLTDHQALLRMLLHANIKNQSERIGDRDQVMFEVGNGIATPPGTKRSCLIAFFDKDGRLEGIYGDD